MSAYRTILIMFFVFNFSLAIVNQIEIIPEYTLNTGEFNPNIINQNPLDPIIIDINETTQHLKYMFSGDQSKGTYVSIGIRRLGLLPISLSMTKYIEPSTIKQVTIANLFGFTATLPVSQQTLDIIIVFALSMLALALQLFSFSLSVVVGMLMLLANTIFGGLILWPAIFTKIDAGIGATIGLSIGAIQALIVCLGIYDEIKGLIGGGREKAAIAANAIH